MLNDKVIPFFDEMGIDLVYCGKVENHSYLLYVAMEDIAHSKTKANHPQTNGICERFHRTMKEEFYGIAFRKKIYASLEELQIDVAHWIANNNETRPHSGKYCYGKTPMQTFRETKHLATEKTIPVAESADSADHLTRAACGVCQIKLRVLQLISRFNSSKVNTPSYFRK